MLLVNVVYHRVVLAHRILQHTRRERVIPPLCRATRHNAAEQLHPAAITVAEQTGGMRQQGRPLAAGTALEAGNPLCPRLGYPFHAGRKQ